MHGAAYAKLPVTYRGEIVGYALVDVDMAWLGHLRWFMSGRYVSYAPRHGRNLSLHRVVLGLERGDGLEGDHINGDIFDNRRSNLRTCTRRQNGQNRTSTPGSTSRFRGVHWDRARQRWRASAQILGKSYNLGSYASEQEAATAAAAFRREHMPFANEARAA